MLKRYDVTSTEQAKVIAHPLRLQILALFHDAAPRTSKQVADLLDLPPAKVHYHVRELLRVGLIELISTKEKGGVIEKYYLPIAREFRIILEDNESEENPPNNAKHAILHNMLDEYKSSFIQAMERSDRSRSEHANRIFPSIRSYNFILSDPEFIQLHAELEEVLERWKEQSLAHAEAKKADKKTFRILFSHYEKPQPSKKSSNIKID